MSARSGRGPGCPGSPRQGKVSACRPPVGTALGTEAGEVGRGKDRGERQINRKKTKREHAKHVLLPKRQLKGKQEDTISEGTKNKVSNVSLTRAAQTSSFLTRASDSAGSGQGTLSLSRCWLPQLLTHFA